MDIVASTTDLRAHVRAWRAQQDRIAFVPTMGNLHAGHLKLVRHARSIAGRVVVSIFVNPMQFGPGEDYDSYPRTLADDTAALMRADADLLFVPAVSEIYPGDLDNTTRVVVPGLGEILCGAFRPGFFTGVATVVTRLLNLVQPDIAVFGEKDYQQLIVIRRMVRELCLPVSIEGVATAREADGLAMSSRNGYLNRDRARHRRHSVSDPHAGEGGSRGRGVRLCRHRTRGHGQIDPGGLQAGLCRHSARGRSGRARRGRHTRCGSWRPPGWDRHA